MKSLAEIPRAEIRAELDRLNRADPDEPKILREANRSLKRWLERELVCPQVNRGIERRAARGIASKRKVQTRGPSASGSARPAARDTDRNLLLRLQLAAL